jgi:hypothetical protein
MNGKEKNKVIEANLATLQSSAEREFVMKYWVREKQ